MNTIHQVGDIYEIQKGTLLYHGTSWHEDFDMPYGPAWVSMSRSVAEYFAGWRQSSYDTDKDWERPRLLVFRATRVIWLLATYTTEEFHEMLEQVGAEYEVDGPTELAEAFCAFTDLDGWILPANYPDGDDTMLCDPESVLEFVEEISL